MKGVPKDPGTSLSENVVTKKCCGSPSLWRTYYTIPSAATLWTAQITHASEWYEVLPEVTLLMYHVMPGASRQLAHMARNSCTSLVQTFSVLDVVVFGRGKEEHTGNGPLYPVSLQRPLVGSTFLYGILHKWPDYRYLEGFCV